MNLEASQKLVKDLYAQKQQKLLAHFRDAGNPETVYQKIIEMGRNLPPFSDSLKNEDLLVKGCQSLVYLRAFCDDQEKICFEVGSDALISAGLAALLLAIYHQEPLELLLYCPPLFIKELGLHQSLTPGRSNGLLSMYAKMKNEAIKLFLELNSKNK